MSFDPTKEKQLIVVDKAELKRYWHLVEPGLIKLRADKEPADKWITPEVYATIISGQATLIFTSISREPGTLYTTRDEAIKDSCGFGVVQVLTDNDTGESRLHIWIAVSDDSTNKDGAGSILRAFDNEISQMARDAGCSYITFASNRDFWLKVGPKYGCEIDEIRWKKAIWLCN